jgi:hypothetical protein
MASTVACVGCCLEVGVEPDLGLDSARFQEIKWEGLTGLNAPSVVTAPKFQAGLTAA